MISLSARLHSLLEPCSKLMIASLLALLVAGCGGDDDGPTTPPPGGGTDDFDEATAITQSQLAASQAVSLVQSMTTLAGGLAKNSDKDFEYGWNEETARWEWIYDHVGEGYTYDYFYTVQYLDADGDPQQNVAGAVAIDHRLRGDSSYHYESDGTVIDQDWSYFYNTLISGIGSAILTMTGDGGYDWDHAGHSGGSTFHYTYDIDWVTAPSITQPASGGCPTGTIRYDFSPFYCLVVFDGSDEAVSTVYRANGEPVAGSADTHQLFCSR